MTTPNPAINPARQAAKPQIISPDDKTPRVDVSTGSASSAFSDASTSSTSFDINAHVPATIPFYKVTPTDATTSEHVINRFIYIHSGLTKIYPNLQPGEITNELFSEMVQLCIVPYNEAVCNAVLTDARIMSIITDLRKYSAEGEGMLERYWAQRMLETPSESTNQAPGLKHGFLRKGCKQPTQAEVDSHVAAISLLRQFPYYQNYVDLARLELNAILSVSPATKPPRKFAFLGSGPMPLTAICLAQLLDPVRAPSTTPADTRRLSWPWKSKSKRQVSTNDQTKDNIQIHNIDRCPIAISLSSSLCKSLGRLTRCLTFEHTDASDSTDLTAYDVVYLAALVGTEAPEKTAIITSVAARMTPGSLLVMRSAHGMRQVLYPVVEPAEIMSEHNTPEEEEQNASGAVRVVPLVVVHPWNEVVNSIVVAKVVISDI